MQSSTDTGNTIKAGLTYFVASFLFGFVIHAQALLFTPDATDSIRAYGSTQAQVGSGRFIGHLLDILFENLGFYQPFRYVNVLFYLLFAAAAAALVVQIFDVGQKGIGLAISFFIMSGAMNSGILAYFYVAHMYGLALFLSVLACWLILKRNAAVLPVLLIAFSLGIYQAYLSTVILLIFVYQLLLLLRKETEVRVWIFGVLRCMALVMEALVLYMLLNRLYLALTGQAITGYGGMGTNVVPAYDLAKLFGLFTGSYRFLFGLPFTDTYFLSDNVVMRLCIGVFLAALLLQLLVFFLSEKTPAKRALLLLLIIVLPCMINLPMFLQDEVGERVTLNWYFVFLIPLLFCDVQMQGRLQLQKERIGKGSGAWYALCGGRKAWVVPAACAVFAAASCTAIGYNIYRTENVYASYIKAHELAEDIVHDIEERFAETEGFSLEKDIIFVGSLNTKSINKYFFNVEYEAFLSHLFNRDHSSIFQRYATHKYNILIPSGEGIQDFSIEEFNALNQDMLRSCDYFYIKGVHDGLPTIHSGSRKIMAMPSYPDAGCVREVDGVIVCKLSD